MSIDGGSSNLDNAKFSAAQEKVESPKGKENVLYAPKVKIVPDTHGLDPSHYGVDKNSRDVVSIGDLIDAPKNLRKRSADQAVVEKDLGFYPQYKAMNDADKKLAVQREMQHRELTNKAADSVNIRNSVETWSHLMETDQGTVVLGNHELMALSGIRGNDDDMANWLIDSNKGSTTLEAFGINLKDLGIPTPRIVPDPADSTGEKKMLVDVPTKEQFDLIRQKVNENKELSKFFDLLQSKGKMYMIANEALVVHAGIPLDKDGHLIPPQRGGANWNGFDGIVGLDAMDKIQEGIRSGNKDILHYLASGDSNSMSPAWMRKPFFDAMKDDNASTQVMTELSAQAKKRGADIKAITIGHSESVGGSKVGKFVYGTDTAVGDVVTLDATNGKAVEVQVRHNFGSKDKISYDLTKQTEASAIKSETAPAKAKKAAAKETAGANTESEKNIKARESNAKSLEARKKMLTAEYDVEFAELVTSGLIALGFEGTEATRTSANTQTNIESLHLNLRTSKLAFATITEIISEDIDPALREDVGKLMAKGDAATEAEVKSLSGRIQKITDTIYKASRGNKADLADPSIAKVADQIESFKKMKTTEEIITQSKNPELKRSYEEWKKKNEGREPFTPGNFDRALFDDMVIMQIEEASIVDGLARIEQEENPLIVDPKKLPSAPIKSLSTALVSVYGDVGGKRVKTDAFGSDIEYEEEAREAIEVGVERTAAIAETEKKAKWGVKRKEGQSWISYAGEVVKNNIDRGWRTMFSDKLHHAKEVRHGLRMMAEAGVETGLTTEFVSQVDAEARKRIEKSREKMSKFGRLKAKTRDFFSEVIGKERDLHSVKEEVIRDWRKKFDENPFDAKDNPIYDLVMSDMESRNEIARRVSESTRESLHLSGENKGKKTIKIESDSEYGKFLNEQIFKVAIRESLDRQKAGEKNINALSPKLRVDLDKKLNDFYQTEEFRAWKDSLSASEQEMLPDSFTYASDMLAQVEGSLIPNALELSDYYDKAKKLEIDLDLTIGKAQYGPNGEITPEGAGRVKLKREVLAKMHERPAIFTSEDMGGGINRANFIAKADQLVNNPLGAAIVGFFAGRAIMTTAKAAGGAIGVGALGGIKAGFREWAKLGTELQQIDIEKAIGLRRAEDAKKYHKLEQFTNKSVIMSEHAENIDTTIAKLGENVTAEGVTGLMAHIVNGEARVSLGVKRKINLIAAKSVGGNETAERQNYQLERRKFDFAQAKARVELKRIAAEKPEVWETVRKELGFRKGTSIDKILEELRLTQEDNLLDGSTIPDAYESVLGTISLEQQESIKGKAKLFKNFRTWSSVKQGAIVGVTAGLFTWGMGEFAENHHEITLTDHETIPAIVVSPDAPLHPDGLLNGVGEIDGNVIHAKLPEGMTLVPVQGPALEAGDHTFNLMVDGQEKPYVTGIQFNEDGTPDISPAVQAQLTAQGVTITPQPLASHIVDAVLPAPEGTLPTEHMSIRMGDLEGRDQGGIWDWMMNSVRGENPDVGINMQTNGAYKLFRAYENMRGNDNFVIQEEPGIPHRVIHTVTTNWHGQTMQEVLPAVNPDNMVINDLPALFATPEGHQRIADVVAEASRMHDAGQTLDRFHQIVYTAAISGESGIPNAEDTAYVMAQFDAMNIPAAPPAELVAPHEIFIEIDKPVIENIVTTVQREVPIGGGVALPLIIDWRRPLEAAEGTKAPTSATYESTKGPEPKIKLTETPAKKTETKKEIEEPDKTDKKNKTAKEVDLNESNITLPEKEIKENKVVKEIKYKDVEIRIVVGDIRNAKTDAVVVPSDSTLTLSMGEVENAIAEKMGRSNYIRNAKKAKEYLSKISAGGAEGDVAKTQYIFNTADDGSRVYQPFVSANDALNSSLQVWDEKEHTKDGELRFGASIAMPSAGELAKNNIKTVVLTNARPEHHIGNLNEADIAHMVGSSVRAANVVGATSVTIPAIGTGTGSDSGFGLTPGRTVHGFLAGAKNYVDTMAAVEVVPKRDKNGNFIPIYSEDGKEIRAVESETKPVEGHKPITVIELIIYAEPNESNIEIIKRIIDESGLSKETKERGPAKEPEEPNTKEKKPVVLKELEETKEVSSDVDPKGKKRRKKKKGEGVLDSDITDQDGVVEENGEEGKTLTKDKKEKRKKKKDKNGKGKGKLSPKEKVIDKADVKNTKNNNLNSEIPEDNIALEEDEKDALLKSKEKRKRKNNKNNKDDENLNSNIELVDKKKRKRRGKLPENVEDLSSEEIIERKKRIKKHITVVEKSESDSEKEPDLSQVKIEVKDHLIENQSLADFAALEYGAIARTLNKLTNSEVQAIIKGMENRPDLQAVYRAAMIGLRILPQDFEHSKERYNDRIIGTKMRIDQLNASIEKESKRRLVSIFEPNFASEFNGKITWEKAKSLDELPDFARGTLILPENVTVDKEKISLIAEESAKELREMNDEENNIDVDNLRPLRDEISKLEQEAIAEGILKIVNGKKEKHPRSGNRKAGDRAMLRRIDEKVKILGKIEDKWNEYYEIIEYRDSDLSSARSRTVPLSTYKNRAKVGDADTGESQSVVIGTNLSKSTLRLLDAFSIDGKPVTLDYLLDNDTNISWRTGSGKLISNGRANIVFDEGGVQKAGVIEFDSEGNPTEETKRYLREHRFWDDEHEYRAVTPAYPGEIINYSQKEVDRLKAEVEKQNAIAAEYQILIDAIGDRDTEGTFANKISVATELVNDALAKKMFRILEFVKNDPDYAAKYPIMTGAFGNDNQSKFVKDTDRISVEDLLLGAILLGNKEMRKKLDVKTAKKITELQEQVSVDDLSILQYSRSVDKPVELNDENRARMYVEDFTRGDAMKYVLSSKGQEFARIQEVLPYDQKEVAVSAKNYTFS